MCRLAVATLERTAEHASGMHGEVKQFQEQLQVATIKVTALLQKLTLRSATLESLYARLGDNRRGGLYLASVFSATEKQLAALAVAEQKEVAPGLLPDRTELMTSIERSRQQLLTTLSFAQQKAAQLEAALTDAKSEVSAFLVK